MTPSTSVAFRAILEKDLRTELRTLQSLPAMALFAVTTFVIFRFGLDRTELSGSLASGRALGDAAVRRDPRRQPALRRRAAGGRLRRDQAGADRPHGAVRGQGGGARSSTWSILEAIVVPVFAIFFLDSAAAIPPLAAVLLLADVGLAATGTLISSMAVHSRARDLLGPLVLLPLVVPLMIAATGASRHLLEVGGPVYERFGTWLAVLGLYDLIFLLVGYAVFDFLLED